jgi:hypothetical protein
MKQLLFIFIACHLANACISQEVIGRNKEELRRTIKIKKTEFRFKNSIIIETDSTVGLRVHEKESVEMDYTYTLGKDVLCYLEEMLITCRQCTDEHFNLILKKKKYKWVRINENTYVSSFGKKRLLERVYLQEKENYIRITKMNWSQKTYEEILPSS